MSYPKPLSKKTLEKMYREANINESTGEFLHKFFLAAVNLYGAITVENLWQIFKEIAAQYGKTGIKRKDVIAFSAIARREDVPYYVYEIDEIYYDEIRKDIHRMLVHKSLVDSDGGKWRNNGLIEAQLDIPYYIPEDFLLFAAPNATPEETKLLNFLSELKVNLKETEDSNGDKIICEHVGEKLGSFSFMNSDESFLYEWNSGEFEFHPQRNEKALQELIDRTSCTEAEKILRNYKEECYSELCSPSESLERLFEELNEVGVRLTDSKYQKLLKLLMEFSNNSNLWCTRGWTPNVLAKMNLDGE